MSGIYISDMEMPKNCKDCTRMGISHCPMKEEPIIIDGCEKPLNCPIKEVSTNGRLGDLDALKSYLDNTINDATEIGLPVTSEYLMGLIDDAIKNAPTVLEATKGRKK